MRVLLINPGDYGCIRAQRILALYARDYKGEPSRSRYHAIVYTREDYSEPVAVWHSQNQITMHFGDDSVTTNNT